MWASYFVKAARAIQTVQPEAHVAIGGIGGIGANRTAPDYLDMDVFLARATAREPTIRSLATSVSVIAYPGVDAERQLQTMNRLRSAAREGGIPDSTPMLVSEIGWPTQGDDAVSEAERVDAYRVVTRDLPRTNCNVSGITQHSWMSNEASRDSWSWVGIAQPFSGALYPAGKEYVSGVAIQLGNGASEAPQRTHTACEGMPNPDTDRDGVLDEDDYYPLDGTRTDPPGGGTSGGGTSGGGGGAVNPPGGGGEAGDPCDRMRRLRTRRTKLRGTAREARASGRWGRYYRLRVRRSELRDRLRVAKRAVRLPSQPCRTRRCR